MFQTTSIRTTRPSKVRQRLPLLGIHNRDHAARIICRILLAQPRLLSLARIFSRGIIWPSSSRLWGRP